MTTIGTASSETRRRNRLKLKRIVISEHNYLALRRLGYAGDSFNDVISKLLRIQKNHQEKQQQLQQQQSDDDNSSSNSELFHESISEMFERERQQLVDLVRLQEEEEEEQEQSNNQESNREVEDIFEDVNHVNLANLKLLRITLHIASGFV